MTFAIPEELKEQMRLDGVRLIHIRDVISVDVNIDGTYATDWDSDDNKVVLKNAYIEKVNSGLVGWFDSFNSDSEWYSNIEGDCINVHSETLEEFAQQIKV